MGIAAPYGNFDTVRAATEADLVAPVAAALKTWNQSPSVIYVETDPDYADTAVFCETYAVPPEASANCVMVAAKRGQDVTLAACLVLATTRLDVNTVVRKRLGARKASFASMDTAVAETGMEYGGITPVGLPEGWPLLIDARVAEAGYVLVGSGARRGKLFVPGTALAELASAEVVEGLAG